MKPPTIIGCILLALLAGCNRAASPGALRFANPLPEPFVDATLRTTIEDRGGEFDAAAFLSADDIAKQLQRTTCRVNLAPAKAAARDLPRIYKDAVPSVFVIANLYQCDKCTHWHTRGAASAFAIAADGVCVTNDHVFEHVDAGARMVIADAWGHVYPVIEILAASRRDDVAIFRVDTGSEKFTPLALRAGTEVGSPVAVISHPANHFYSLSTGIISRRSSRYHGMNGDIKDAPDEAHPEGADHAGPDTLTPTIEVTADFGVGSSGGPVLDSSGNVIAMVSNTQPVYADPKERRSLQMNFHHCVPAESILALINAK